MQYRPCFVLVSNVNDYHVKYFRIISIVERWNKAEGIPQVCMCRYMESLFSEFYLKV